jgi:hypothetical protein
MKDRVLFLQSISGMWIDLTDDFGCSPLHHAVQDGCIPLVESLLLAGACVNMSDGCGVTPIMIAINNNKPELVKILIKYGAQINGSFQGNIPNPIQMACNIGNEAIMQILEDRTTYEKQARHRVCEDIGLSKEPLHLNSSDVGSDEAEKPEVQGEDIHLNFNLSGIQSLHQLYAVSEIEHPMNLDLSKKFREIFTPKITLWNVYLVYLGLGAFLHFKTMIRTA